MVQYKEVAHRTHCCECTDPADPECQPCDYIGNQNIPLTCKLQMTLLLVYMPAHSPVKFLIKMKTMNRK